jgi:hypothetical protein
MNKIFSTLDNPKVKEKKKEEKDYAQILGNLKIYILALFLIYYNFI